MQPRLTTPAIFPSQSCPPDCRASTSTGDRPGSRIPRLTLRPADTCQQFRPVNRWTDTASAHEERGHKHRSAQESRRVPIPPELGRILREHIACLGVSSDGRVFSSERGHIVASAALSDVCGPAGPAATLSGAPADHMAAATPPNGYPWAVCRWAAVVSAPVINPSASDRRLPPWHVIPRGA